MNRRKGAASGEGRVLETGMEARAAERLQGRIVGFALAGILATGLLVGLATAIPSYHSAQAALETSADYHVRLQAQTVGQFLQHLGELAMQVTSRTQIRVQLERYNAGQVSLAELEEYSAPKLRDAMEQQPEAVGVIRLDAAGKAVVRVGQQVPPEHWPVPAAEARGPRLTGPVRVGDRVLLIAGAPILNRDGQRVGTDLVVFRDQGLLHTLADARGGTDRVYLFHRGGAGAISSDAGRGELVELTSLGAAAAALVQAAAGERGLLHVDTDGVPTIFFYTPAVPEWGLVMAIPEQVLYQPALQELVAPGMTILLLLVLGALGTSRLIRPVALEVVQLNRRLQGTAEEQRALLEHARGFLFRNDRQGHLTDLSPTVEDVLGYPPEALPEALREQLAGVGLGEPAGELAPRLLPVTHRAGHDVVLEVNANASADCLLGVVRDVTKRARAEQALRTSEERLRTLINAGPDFICFKDAQGRWQEVNRAGQMLFGLSADGYRGRTDAELAELVDPALGATLRGFAEADHQAWEGAQAVRSEERIAQPGGESRVYDLIRVPLVDDGGRRTGLVMLGRDVTERHRFQRELERSAAEWNFAMDFLEDAICLVDLDDRVLRANQSFYRLVGQRAAQVIGRELAAVLHPHGEPVPCRVCAARRRHEDVFVTLESDHPDNPTGRPIEMMVKVIPDAEGQPARMLLGVHDLSRVRQTEEELRLAASVFEGSHEGIAVTDARHRVLRVNEAFTRITGYTTEEATGHTLDELLSARKHEQARYQYMWETVERRGLWQGEAWYGRKNGETFPAWHRISALRNMQGELMHYINLFTDITEKKLSEERIHHLAHYDALTDLPNRLLFIDRLNHAMERSQRRLGKVGLLFLDLDRFKNINDTLGHEFGDSLLQVIAQRLREAVREQDTVARLGGDEFTVILEELERVQDAGSVARKILEAVAQPVPLRGHELFVAGSIGISVFPDDGRDVQTLLRNADSAMYRAKEEGRNTYQFYTPELTEASLERMDLENALRRALERGELLLHYQPQVEVASQRIIGAEALLRWQHPTKGLIPPTVFIPLAEDSGLMPVLGEWVTRTACRQLKAWQAEGLPMRRVAVNLSGHQITRGDLVNTVRTILEETGLEPTELELEVTEGYVMSHLNEGLQTLHGLKALGVTLAIDDFGTGYSSLAYLKRLPIDRLKIDRSFVKDIPADHDDMAIAATIIAMAHNLDLQVIAEGVEQVAQLDFLRRHHCDEVQGYLFGRPVPPDSFADLIAESRAQGE